MYLSPTHYLPSEELKFSNYPEVYNIMDKNNELQKGLEAVTTATYLYSEGIEDAIYINIAEVENLLNLSYEITDVLGSASNVCYDMLLPLRDVQESLHELIFSFRYEKTPIVIDKQRRAMRELDAVVLKTGEKVS